MFFFFKQKTAYEMRISDWSSDVCSSDLLFYDQFDERGAAPDDDTAAPGGQQEAADQGLSPSGEAGAAYPRLERPRRNAQRDAYGLERADAQRHPGHFDRMGGGEEGARRQPCLRLAQFAQVERGAIERAAGVDAAGPLRIIVRPAAGVTQGQALIVEEAGEGGAVPHERLHPAAVDAVLTGTDQQIGREHV